MKKSLMMMAAVFLILSTEVHAHTDACIDTQGNVIKVVSLARTQICQVSGQVVDQYGTNGVEIRCRPRDSYGGKTLYCSNASWQNFEELEHQESARRVGVAIQNAPADEDGNVQLTF